MDQKNHSCLVVYSIVINARKPVWEYLVLYYIGQVGIYNVYSAKVCLILEIFFGFWPLGWYPGHFWSINWWSCVFSVFHIGQVSKLPKMLLNFLCNLNNYWTLKTNRFRGNHFTQNVSMSICCSTRGRLMQTSKLSDANTLAWKKCRIWESHYREI